MQFQFAFRGLLVVRDERLEIGIGENPVPHILKPGAGLAKAVALHGGDAGVARPVLVGAVLGDNRSGGFHHTAHTPVIASVHVHMSGM